MRKLYDCTNCPGYCCSYPVIAVTAADIKRLANYHEITVEEATKRFTKSAHGEKHVLRRKTDEHYGRICRFFDTEKRRCTVYTARPAICRSFPGSSRCGYYDFLMFERRKQDDPQFVATTDNGLWE